MYLNAWDREPILLKYKKGVRSRQGNYAENTGGSAGGKKQNTILHVVYTTTHKRKKSKVRDGINNAKIGA